jgi:hypothetical protein
MMNPHSCRSSALMAMIAALTLACSSKSSMKGGLGTGGAAGASQTIGSGGGGGNPGTGGSMGSGGIPGTGGVGGGGKSGTGGGLGSGGSTGTGGGTSDGGLQVSCTDDGGVGLPVAARSCTRDSECTIAIIASCCGLDQALGEAKSQSSTYASCSVLPPGACDGRGCGKIPGYATDTGRTTPTGGSSSHPIDLVSVHCLNQLCTSDVADVQDAGQDVPPAVDAAVDLSAQGCGDAAACGSGQACVLSGGSVPGRCLAQEDGGACSVGLLQVSLCTTPGGTIYRPGCTDPSGVPLCVGLADGCSDPCSCVCPFGGGACTKGPGYTICMYP